MSATSTPLLSTRGLAKQYPGVLALGGFDIDLRPGEIHGVVGANGAGKSTLIKILSGLEQPTSGRVLLDGHERTLPDPAAAQAIGISVVHQELPLLGNMTVAQNIALGREQGGLLSSARPSVARQQYNDTARAFPGAPAAGRKLENEGLFAWQIVAIVRAISADARVLVLDEPTSSLSVDERNALHIRLKELAGDGLAILYVSHFLDDILDVATVVSVLRDGRLAHRGPTADLDEASLLEHMTGGTASLSAKGPDTPDNVPGAPGRPPALVFEDMRTGGTHVASLTVRAGEIVGLYGLEGSGAREVLEATLALRPRSGSVRWQGAELGGTPRHVIRAGVALVTGDRKRTAIGDWTVEMNHALPSLAGLPLLKRTPRSAIRDEVRRSIESFGVKGRSGQRMRMLSGGNQQKLMLSRWVELASPMCLLLDEPTHGVDVAGRLAIHDQLRAFAGRGNAVVLHSTDPEEVVALCHRAIPFANGRPLAHLNRDALSIDRLEHAVRASARHHTSEVLG